MGRQFNWDYEEALKRNERLCGVLHTWELAGPDGAHYHFWFRANTTAAQRRVHKANATYHFDIVSWSWDYIPEKTNA